MRVVLGVLAIAASLTAAPALADSVVRELPLNIEVAAGQTQFVHFRINAQPSFTFVRGNEDYSNFSTQIVRVIDVKSGDVVSTVRQSDINFVDAYLYLPAKYIGADNRAHLVLQASSPWILTGPSAANPVEVLSAEPTGTTGRFQTYEVMFGKPDDHPFLGENLSYAEGAYRLSGNWVFNKYFRYGNDPSTLNIPLEPNSSGYLMLDAYLSANALISLNGKETAIFERSLGNRFFQDYYRTRYEAGAGAHTMRVANVAPFRAKPTNLRQMAFAFNAVEVATPRPVDGPRLDFIDLLNTRLDYRHRAGAREALLAPRNAVAELLKHQGGSWLPSRDPVTLPAGAKRKVDAVVLLDPSLGDIVNTAYATGDVWINAAVGAAMMLEQDGYSVAYAAPDQLASLKPSVVYIPSQPFYRNIFTPAVMDQLQASGAKLIIDPSLSGEFINNPSMEAMTGLQFKELAYFIPRDEVEFPDGTKTDTFHSTPVMAYKILDPALKPEASLHGLGLPIAFRRTVGKAEVEVLAYPAGYTFFNYGLRPQQLLVSRFLKTAPRPLVSATSDSQVRAYVIRQERCTADVMIENNNFGAFNYYGFAVVTSPKPSTVPPPVSRVVLGGALFAGRTWTVSGPVKSEPVAGGVAVLNLARDTVVSLTDPSCAKAR
jgi:hypothetical protein